MTLSATYEPRRQQGNGITKEFSYSFDPYSPEALKVYIEENGVQSETQDYTATVSENGGIVTFNVAPTSEQYVVITRSVPQDQEVPFYTSSGFDAGVVENSLDKLTAMIQEVNNETVRSAKLPKGYNINLELPVPESGKGLYWNNEGTGFQNSRLNLDDVETLTKSYRDQAVSARDEAVSSSTRAVNTVKEATDLLANTQTYVGEAIDTINTAVEDAKTTISETSEEAKETINSYVTNAEEEVRSIAQEEANKAIEDAAAAATEIATNNIQPLVNEAVNKAEEAINNADDAANSAIAARVWSTGEDAEVEEIAPGEEEHSSRGYADLAMAIANTPEDTPIELGKLAALNVIKGPKGEKGDKGDKGEDGKDGVDGKSVFDGYATNCITEIPQDIKLELKDGVLTLKAGSKVYVPNGAGKFDEVIVSGDEIIGQSGTVSGAFTFYRSDINDCYSAASHHIYSGATAPSDTTVTATWYDTTNNVIKVYDGTAWRSGVAFPLCRFSNSNSLVTSIDQVFNGFGYIGSTVFALPGVKGLIPNGRNEDGSLRNIEYTSDKLTMQTLTSETTGAWSLGMWNDGNRVAGTNVKYDSYSNKMVGSTRGTCVELAYFAATNGVVTSFTPKFPFHAVDRNDSSWVAAQAMPSGRYIDLTLGASLSYYTAPANGYFYFQRQLTGSGFQALVVNEAGYMTSEVRTHLNAGALRNFIPIRKGQQLQLQYDGSFSSSIFRFIYAEGEK